MLKNPTFDVLDYGICFKYLGDICMKVSDEYMDNAYNLTQKKYISVGYYINVVQLKCTIIIEEEDA